MAAAQSYKNHTKLDPLHHFIITPILLADCIAAFLFWNRHGHEHPQVAFWWVILSITLLLLSEKMRAYSLTIQDRIIRLEERLRLTALLPVSEHGTIASFTKRQLIALRFASDAELPVLARRTLAENLDPKQIKQIITEWRPDTDRI